MPNSIEAKVTEYREALIEKARLTEQENTVKAQRLAANHRLNLAKQELRDLEDGMQYLIELKIVTAQVAAKAEAASQTN